MSFDTDFSEFFDSDAPSLLPTRTAVKQVVSRTLKMLKTDLSLRIYDAYRAEDTAALAAMELPNVLSYSTAYEFQKDFQAYSLLRKSTGFLPEVKNLREQALCAFVRNEDQCAETNRRLRQWIPTPFSSILERARGFIDNVLGQIPVHLFDLACWGPGATASLRRSQAQAQDKILERDLGTTVLCQPYLQRAIYSNPHWVAARGGLDLSFSVQRASRGAFVPKDNKSLRLIALEPTGNMFLQKAVGGYIRSRLRQVGYNIRSLQPAHREYARRSSIDGNYATLDLRNASDTISKEIVKRLLPPEWFSMLDRLRSHEIAFDEVHFFSLEKFSSMGNGFTFELETLLFLSLLHGCECSEYSAYGDDLIVPTTAVPLVVSVLQFCGFTLNYEKSYAYGSFRESCGGNFFNGQDVTPKKLKNYPSDHLSHVIFINSLAKVSELFDEKMHLFDYFKKVRGCRFISPPGWAEDGVFVTADVFREKTRRTYPWSSTRRAPAITRGYETKLGPHGFQEASYSLAISQNLRCSSEQRYGLAVRTTRIEKWCP